MNFNQKITRKELEKFLARHATPMPVLDIGAGHVASNHSYTKFFPNRHTVDVDAKRQPDTIGDIHSLPFPDQSYETLLCTEVLEHCHTPVVAVKEMARVLKPGGKLILTTRFVYPLHDVPNDYFRFTKYGLRRLFNEWEIVELIPETKTFTAIGALLQRVGFQTTLRGGKVAKVLVYTLAFLFSKLDWLIKSEYGNIQRTSPDDCVMSTGYYLVARKTQPAVASPQQAVGLLSGWHRGGFAGKESSTEDAPVAEGRLSPTSATVGDSSPPQSGGTFSPSTSKKKDQ